jgi:hypothetical protein
MIGEIPKTLKVNGVDTDVDSRLGSHVGETLKIEGMPFETNVYCYSHKW